MRGAPRADRGSGAFDELALRPLSRRSLLATTLGAPLWSTLGCAPPGDGRRDEAERPRNLLVLVADDLGRGDVGAYGNAAVTTPSVDRLAREGCRFDDAFTPISLCKPSRSVLYTGLGPHANGAAGFEDIRADVPTLPERLSALGVLTAQIGKLNVSPVERFPFEVLVPSNAAFESGRDPALFERELRHFLARAAGRPWCAFLNFKDPHRPFHWPPDDPPPRRHDPNRTRVHPFLVDTPATRRELADYYDAIERADDGVGRALGVLDELELAADTLVVFTSDNGMPFPYAKATLYDAGIRMPFVVRWPGVVAPGSSEAELVHFADVLPTALDVFGAPPGAADELDGRSLLPLLAGRERFGRTSFVAQLDSNLRGELPIRALRTRGFKYIVNLRPNATFESNDLAGSLTWPSWLRAARDSADVAARVDHLLHRPLEELYDLRADPHELDDRASDPDLRATKEALRAELFAWMTSTGDPRRAEWPF